MPKKLLKIFLAIFLIAFSLNALIAVPAKAQLDPALGDTELEAVANPAYETGGEKSLTVIIGNIIKTVLQFLGILLLILILYGGFLWMTSQGDEEKLGKAKKIIQSAIIGVIIVVLAYVITYFIMNNLVTGITTGELPD